MKNPFLIAEIGGNHEGRFEYAMELVALATQSPVDAVKFQLYRGASIVNRQVDENRYLHFQKFELSKNDHQKIAENIISSGKEYLASVWDSQMLDWIDKYLLRYKVGSGDLTNKQLLSEFAMRGKPIILSTGLSNFEEVENAVMFIRQINPKYFLPGQLSLLQCTSMYPIDDDQANLNVMKTLSKIENVDVGYSDHTVDSEALFLAALMGANYLEFHFTDGRENKTFRDHFVSLTQLEVIRLKERIERAIELRGGSTKEPMVSEIEAGHVRSFRRALFLKNGLKKGELVLESNLVALRPNIGISAWDFDKLVGMRANKDLAELEPLDFSFFDTVSS